jgi:ribosome-associated protein
VGVNATGYWHSPCYTRPTEPWDDRFGTLEGGTKLAAQPARNLAENGTYDDDDLQLEENNRRPERLPVPSSTSESGEALELARRIVDLLSDKLASDIVLLDIRGVSLIADYFVICSAGSERQTTAILKDLSERLLEEQGRKALHTEGRGDSGWVLLDFGDVIVHVFSPQQREYYRLEELWSTATPVVRVQ